jgi:DNA-directed RNA polymerase specialized sigma24 family protein
MQVFFSENLTDVMNSEYTKLRHINPDCPYELIQGCRKGDQKAQLQVYKLYYKPVFSKCMQIVNDPVVAEDIMQESFLIAFENMNSYKGDISFSSWINMFIKDAFKYRHIR